MKEKKTILITIDWFLPGTNSGGPVRSYKNLIDHLKKIYNFRVITRDTDYCAIEPYTNIQSDQWNQIDESTAIYYFSRSNLTIRGLSAAMKDVDYDILMVNGIYSFYFSIMPLFLRNKEKPCIVSARGMLNPQAFSVKSGKKLFYLKMAHWIGLYRHVIFHATNSDEANHIADRIPTVKKSAIKIASNLPRKINSNVNKLPKSPDQLTLVSIARISEEKGTLTLVESLRDLNCRVKLDLYGPIYSDDYWQDCMKVIADLPKSISVNYKGVAESHDVPEILGNYDFSVLLSKGENFGHSILESLAVGCPVIISKNTPWKNLQEIGVGWDVDAENDTIIKKTLMSACKTSSDTYLKMSSNAIEHAELFINDPKLMEANHQLFRESLLYGS